MYVHDWTLSLCVLVAVRWWQISGISVMIWWILWTVFLMTASNKKKKKWLSWLFHQRMCGRVALILFVSSSAGSRHPQKDGPHHWHRSWPPPPQQIHRVSSSQRAAPEGVPLQTHPVPQEGLCTQEGRQLCKFVWDLEDEVQMLLECFVSFSVFLNT